jgi:type IV pilus assembly protein PilN
MYNLDINFLNDRPEYGSDARASSRSSGRSTRARSSGGSGSKAPFWLGLAAAIGLPLLALGTWFGLQARNASLEQEQAELDSQLVDLKAKQDEMAKKEAELKQVKTETESLATVFRQIKPWSSTLKDIRDRTPPNVQIVEVKQLAPGVGGAPAPAPSPAPGGAAPVAPQGVIEIAGLAKDYKDVNDFLLVLQKSSFLRAEETKVLKAELGEVPQLQSLALPGYTQPQTDEPIKLAREVRFAIRTALTEVTAEDLLRELNSKGAVGLVTRIENLRDKGVIKK